MNVSLDLYQTILVDRLSDARVHRGILEALSHGRRWKSGNHKTESHERHARSDPRKKCSLGCKVAAGAPDCSVSHFVLRSLRCRACPLPPRGARRPGYGLSRISILLSWPASIIHPIARFRPVFPITLYSLPT